MTLGSSLLDLRIMLAHEEERAATALERKLTSVGFVVVAAVTAIAEAVDALIGRAPDVALVGFLERRADALAMIDALAARRVCPVLVLVPDGGDDFTATASGMPLWGVVGEPELMERLPACAEVARRRFAEYQDLGAALDRRAVIERASGILMERHGVDGPAAFAMLRTHARGVNAKVFDVAGAVVQGHALLPATESRAPRKKPERSPVHRVHGS